MKLETVYLLIIALGFLSCDKTKKPIINNVTLTQIDSLSNESEVERFIKNSDTLLARFKLIKIKDFERDDRFDIDSFSKIIADSLKIDKSFYKSDLDNNGYTDLLFIGDDSSCDGGNVSCNFSCNVLMNFGNDSLKNISLKREYKSSFVPIIIKQENQNFLEIHFPENYSWVDKKLLNQRSKSLLTYKFNSFIEYNKNPIDNKIEKIEYQTGLCYGSCPNFELTIEKNRKAKFVAKLFNFSDEGNFNKEEGRFETIISQKDYNNLIDILNYIDFENLKDNYYVSWTDDHDSTLKITYNNGKVKTIKDYGLVGTYGLIKVNTILFDLRFNQNWKPVKIVNN